MAIDSQGGKRVRAKRTARAEVRISRVESLTPEEHKGAGRCQCGWHGCGSWSRLRGRRR